MTVVSRARPAMVLVFAVLRTSVRHADLTTHIAAVDIRHPTCFKIGAEGERWTSVSDAAMSVYILVIAYICARASVTHSRVRGVCIRFGLQNRRIVVRLKVAKVECGRVRGYYSSYVVAQRWLAALQL